MAITKTDQNQAELVALARQYGATVWDTHELRDGGPDTVIGSGFGLTIVGLHPAEMDRIRREIERNFPAALVLEGSNILVEIKNGALPPSRQRLTPDEERFHQTWQGPIAIVKNEDELEQVLGLKRIILT